AFSVFSSVRSAVRSLLRSNVFRPRRCVPLRATPRARRWLNADRYASFTAAGSLEEVAPPPPLEELLARLEHSPVLARWDAEIERRIAGIALARADRIPGVTLYAGARHFNATDDVAAVFDVAVPLPLFDRNQGSIIE